MKLRLLTLTLLTTLLTLRLTASTVDSSQIVTFQAGTPATAADMNQTIQALVTAINDNAPKDLKGSSWKIITQTIALGANKSFAGGVDDPNPSQNGDVTGYTVIGIEQILRYGETTITLNGTATSGNLTGSATSRERKLRLEDAARHWDGDTSNPTVSFGIQPEQIDTPEVVTPITGTWTVSGNTLTLTINGDTIPLTLSARRDMLISANGSQETLDIFNNFEGAPSPELQTSTTIIGIRTNP